ncbi:type I 3-dehydroquinate dehydratase [Pseudoxanthomonas sp. JBR18]|uniref:type I 3-dehydroquinate dehydratase n=1 Tax=Pseudoxanthomonas sp. JBR18 TaxID=2969308 RepID=UPI002304D656|nr:type I 3-dehydroquinate dehydratase [Pseudoxanthomonas sp. JBR18]WCE05557.1 type I 3-dehydroquinate dehydratase [Pseudoxanthomonas sp. JBR18]
MLLARTTLAARVLLAISMTAGVSTAAAATDMTDASAAAVPVRTIAVKGVVIGQGAPKTIVPITAKTAAEAIAQAERIGANADTDVVEWRIDYLDIATDAKALVKLAPQVASAAEGKPVILTFRTKAEGGATAISDADYGKLYAALIKAHAADLYDVEMFRDQAVVKSIVAAAHQAGAYIVMSNHDFHATPDTAEIVARLRKQQALGADVLKIAVMPQNPGDVLKLLDATWQMRQSSDRPLLTMSMGPTGVVSRLAGETFGQAMTFGMLGTASAPGQVEVGTLRGILTTLDKATKKTP